VYKRQVGEVVITTLNRRAMPLIRYRTGDSASLDHSPCLCGGVTARLCTIRGRLNPCILAGGDPLLSQDLDDWLYRISGLLDYRLTLERGEREQLQIDFIATPDKNDLNAEIRRMLLQVPAIRDSLADGNSVIGVVRQVESFAASHTLKRTILDRRQQGEV
jgi:phenylacetate-coenzyme A ligase PaaK-like adenylate-forming protein